MSAQPSHVSCLSSDDSARSRIVDAKWIRVLCFLFLAALAVRIIFLFLAPNNSTDAWSRYIAATVWLRHPAQLPPSTASAAWLPMHFWILGLVVWITKSEIAARGFSVLLGSLAIVLLAEIANRSLGSRVGYWSALLLVFWGFHIAFSVTTSSEALTIFLVALGLYAWIRYAAGEGVAWMLVSASAFNIACLCRFEPWLCGPALAFLLVNEQSGTVSPGLVGGRWLQALGFGLLSSLGSLGWLVFSYLKWGDALKLPHRTMWLNAHFQPSHHSALFRAVSVPGSIMISLSPLIAALAIFGAVHICRCGPQSARAIIALVFVLFAFNYYSSVRYEITQARYTLLYSWLIIPVAIEGLVWLTEKQSWANRRLAFTGVMAFFVSWQVAIATAATYGPQPIADHLGALSPLIPLHSELRDLTKWLTANRPQYGSVVLDDYNWESVDIFRFAQLSGPETFSVSQQDYDDPEVLRSRLQRFMEIQHPGLLICSPEGPIGKSWCGAGHNAIQVSGARVQLLLLWECQHWRIYQISYQ